MQPNYSNRLRISRHFVLGLLIAAGLPSAALAEFARDVRDLLNFKDPQGRFELQLSGLIDSETYLLDQPAPGLIFTDENFLWNPRFTLFLDAQFLEQFYVFVQARVDRGFDPADDGVQVRLDEYFLRYTPSKKLRLNFQIGQFATVVGNWVARHDSWQNPFINAPLPYENLTGIWDIAAPGQADTLLYWAHTDGYDTGDYSDKPLRNPIIWGPSYASGIAVMGSCGGFDYAAEIKNTSLSSRPEWWSITQTGFHNPTFSGRAGYRPNAMWNFGVSASAGPYLLSMAEPSLPAGRDIGDYRQLVLAQDVSFAWHHLQLWAEFYQSRFEVPRIGNADTFAYYLEAKYKITPQLFGALRWNQQLFGTIRTDDAREKWGKDIYRVDIALGYRFTNYLQAKLQYSYHHQDADFQEGENVFATQITIKF